MTINTQSVNLGKTVKAKTLAALAEGADQVQLFTVQDTRDQMSALAVAVAADSLAVNGQNPIMVVFIQTEHPSKPGLWIDVADKTLLKIAPEPQVISVNPTNMPVLGNSFRVLLEVSDDASTGAAVNVNVTACFDRGAIVLDGTWVAA